MKKSVLLLLILATVLILSCTIPFGLLRASTSVVVDVEAAQDWTDTGIDIGPGDLLSIHYISGKWSPWPGGSYDAIGSGGDPRCRCNVMDGVSHAALIGKIGDNPPFLVGEEYRHVVGEAGKLYLGINDVDVYDNSGYLEVEVQVIRG